MHTTSKRMLGAAIGAMLLAGSSAVAQTTYTVVNIGSLGYGMDLVSGINNAGQVTGSAPDSAGKIRGFLWTPGATDGVPTNPQMKQLATPKIPGWNDPGTRGLGLNNRGAVAGIAAQGYWFACLWTSPASPQVIGAKSDVNAARAINDAGQAVGYDESAMKQSNRFRYAALWQNGKTYNLGTLSGYPYSDAFGINASGQVVGAATTSFTGGIGEGFLWTPTTPNGTKGTMVALNGLNPSALNDATTIVGARYLEDTIPTSSGPYTGLFARAALWQNGTVSDLPHPSGYHESSARALNNQPDPLIVGSATVYDMDWNGTTHAMLWSGGAVTDLNDAITPPSGWVLTEAVDVNDAGWILCNGTKNGVTAGAVLIPNTPL